MACVRCGRNEDIEKHHILERIYDGSDEPENIEDRCRPCHKYEHARRAILGKLEYERGRGQQDRIATYEHRLAVLDELNTPDLIRERGTYIGYWTRSSTHRLPGRIPTKDEAEVDEVMYRQLALERQNP